MTKYKLITLVFTTAFALPSLAKASIDLNTKYLCKVKSSPQGKADGAMPGSAFSAKDFINSRGKIDFFKEGHLVKKVFLYAELSVYKFAGDDGYLVLNTDDTTDPNEQRSVVTILETKNGKALIDLVLANKMSLVDEKGAKKDLELYSTYSMECTIVR